MNGSGFSRKNMKKEVAKGNLEIQKTSKDNQSDSIIKDLIDYQFKTNIIQYISAFIMFVLGIIISFVNKNGIAVTIGSLVQGDTAVSNITVNLGALFIFGGFYVFLIIVKNSNTKFKQK